MFSHLKIISIGFIEYVRIGSIARFLATNIKLKRKLIFRVQSSINPKMPLQPSLYAGVIARA